MNANNKNYSTRPLTPTERQYATENYHLINKFLKRSKLDPEEFFDVVVFDFLLSVEIYLNNEELQKKCSFEAVSHMYMKRAVYVYFRKEKAKKRSSEHGADISFEELEAYVGNKNNGMEDFSLLEYEEDIKEIENTLTDEQRRIFLNKLEGYTLREIAESNGINPKRVYTQFGKIKRVVADVIETNNIQWENSGGAQL